MAVAWTYKYGDDTIVVKNMTAAELYVNDQLQDRKAGINVSASLTGKLPGGQEIKASLGGIFKIGCSLFIDNELQTPVSEE